MTLWELYEILRIHFGPRADPDTWWPIYYARTTPPSFERAITNILVQNSNWRAVQRAVDSLDQEDLLTASALAQVSEDVIAICVKPTGLQTQKSKRLKDLGILVTQHFKTESNFCMKVSREELLRVPGIGEETADRMLLYTCSRLAWPVDTYCLRVLAHHQVIPALPITATEKRRVRTEIKQMVDNQMPPQLDDWQRLHALMQLEGENIRQRAK